jgi:hypothetical protein
MPEIVTSENLQSFTMQKLGIEQPKAEEKEVKVEPRVEAKPEHETEEKKNKFGERISELTRQRKAAEAEAAANKERAEKLERELNALKSPKNPSDEPKPEEYTDHIQYAKDYADWKVKNELKARDEKIAQERKQAAWNETLKEWEKNLVETRKEIPNLDEVLSSATEIMVSDQVRDNILDSPQGPKILHYLAENPEYTEKLGTYSVQRALREIGKLEERFEKKTPAKENPKEAKEEAPKIEVKKEKAPAPLPKIEGVSEGSPELFDAKGQFTGTPAEWRALRQAGKV